MYEVYDKWPYIAKKSFESDQESIKFEKIKHVVFAGMGGSGTIGDVFASILSKSKIHVNVVKGYVLPKTVNSETLVVITSVSGDSVETRTILEQAAKMNCKIIAFFSGGKMLNFCSKNKIEYRIIPQYHSPRASFTSYLYAILKALHTTLEVKKEEILESITELENLSKKINSSNITEKNPSLDLAEWITGIPIIYFPFGLQAASTRFKNSLNENAKIHVFEGDVIESCHNGIVAWINDRSIQPILIQGNEDNIKTKERWEILKLFFDENEIQYKEIKSISGNILSKLVNLIYLLDYASIYHAVEHKIDPSPVEPIDFIKKRL